jgi:hypothetical protein
MTRIIVMAGQTKRRDGPILLDERVCSAHLSDDHSAAQLIERLGWAITDAEEAEGAQSASARREVPIRPRSMRRPVKAGVG